MNSQDGSSGRGWHHGQSSRRRFLAGAAALSAGALVGARLPLGGRAGRAAAAEGGTGLHGAELRGMYLTSKDRLAEGRFGTMFKKLPAFAPRDDLLDGLARTMVEPDTSDVFLATGPRLFAGFTFIGQFIDHDITFDNLHRGRLDYSHSGTRTRPGMSPAHATKAVVFPARRGHPRQEV